jgi:hypothetical protein
MHGENKHDKNIKDKKMNTGGCSSIMGVCRIKKKKVESGSMGRQARLGPKGVNESHLIMITWL